MLLANAREEAHTLISWGLGEKTDNSDLGLAYLAVITSRSHRETVTAWCHPCSSPSKREAGNATWREKTPCASCRLAKLSHGRANGPHCQGLRWRRGTWQRWQEKGSLEAGFWPRNLAGNARTWSHLAQTPHHWEAHSAHTPHYISCQRRGRPGRLSQEWGASASTA